MLTDLWLFTIGKKCMGKDFFFIQMFYKLYNLYWM